MGKNKTLTPQQQLKVIQSFTRNNSGSKNNRDNNGSNQNRKSAKNPSPYTTSKTQKEPSQNLNRNNV